MGMFASLKTLLSVYEVKLTRKLLLAGACAVFGVPLVVAVERSPCHDGVRLPVLVRQAIDYVEQHGQ